MALRNPLGLLVLAMIFIPLERWFGRERRPLLRAAWKTDLAHHFLSHALEQLALVLAIGTLLTFLEPLSSERVAASVSAQPGWLQLVEALGIVELTGYGMHRAFHSVSWLWPIHAVHHSSPSLDWLAGFRAHPLDQALTRAAQFIPLFLLGFSPLIFGGVTLALGLWAIFLHSNTRLQVRWLEGLVATPHFHQWHHARGAHGNYAGLFPIVDRWCGTLVRARDWPVTFGCDAEVPSRWHQQVLFPFRVSRSRAARAPHRGP